MKEPREIMMKNLEERIGVILDMWDSYTLREIGEKLSVSKQRIWQITRQLRKHGLPIPHKRYPKIDWDALVKRIGHERNLSVKKNADSEKKPSD